MSHVVQVKNPATGNIEEIDLEKDLNIQGLPEYPSRLDSEKEYTLTVIVPTLKDSADPTLCWK